ncbi:uncharacterized protein TRIVIDRAFT_65503 [Trichoderma virens Gv29-8]|uniref:Uncharacterized protein n=1 Tax=Hypocrea virens (strain Gv29-8 / FGSC 10586) TaxID=413071 RepID=G9N9Y1_HYPVG|nr:uncharacterized protein TRIVIDRAFT_65503 [Trichoderma virens Gv29-8]EHK16749.1 hypothetical protein TRIVIDRAFT_65503 [Trichoderma virens Gv29-8]UKZ51874.1 hypothetical protein TrVGV298_005639 [Trichoderma virens]
MSEEQWNFSIFADRKTRVMMAINNVLQQKGPLLHRIVLAGHGFAGIVVKKAVTMANTTKRFYDVALAIDALLFIDSPLQPTDQQNWDELLLKMLDATNISYRGRLAEIHPGLIGSLSQISYDFCQFAAEYRITSIIRKVNSDEFETTKFNTPFEEVIPIFRTRDEMLRCSMQDAEYLGLLKKLFTPRYVNRGMYR